MVMNVEGKTSPSVLESEARRLSWTYPQNPDQLAPHAIRIYTRKDITYSPHI